MKRHCYLENTLTSCITAEEALDLARFKAGKELEIKKGFRTFNLIVDIDDMYNVWITDLSNQSWSIEYIEVGEID